MGGFWSSLSGPPGKKVTAHDRAVLDLKIQRDKLKQYHKKLHGVIARETEIAKQLLVQGKRDKALLTLKKKRYQENLLAKSEGQLQNIQEMVDSIEFAQMEQQVFNRLAEGNAVLKEIHSQMTLDDVEKLMLDTEDALAYQKEIEDLLAQNKFTTEDEEEIMEELQEIINQTSLAMPAVPTQEPQLVAPGMALPTWAPT